MGWLQKAVCVLAVVVMSGCPSEFGKEGRVSKAVRKDAQEQLGITRCSDKMREEACAPGKEKSPECLRCGG
jgi:hypothetical protein